jgi:hypothetical protein
MKTLLFEDGKTLRAVIAEPSEICGGIRTNIGINRIEHRARAIIHPRPSRLRIQHATRVIADGTSLTNPAPL